MVSSQNLLTFFISHIFNFCFWNKFINYNQIVAGDDNFAIRLGCFDLFICLMMMFQDLEYPIGKTINSNDFFYYLEPDTLYLIESIDYVDEFHSFIIIVDGDGKCITLSMYGGRENVFHTIYDMETYVSLWKKYFDTQVKENLLPIFAIRSIYQDYTFISFGQIYRLKLKDINLEEMISWLEDKNNLRPDNPNKNFVKNFIKSVHYTF